MEGGAEVCLAAAPRALIHSHPAQVFGAVLLVPIFAPATTPSNLYQELAIICKGGEADEIICGDVFLVFIHPFSTIDRH